MNEQNTGHTPAQKTDRESKLCYQLLFTESLVPTFLIDSETRTISDVNQMALELTGYAKDELIGVPFAKAMAVDSLAVNELLERIKEVGTLRTTEISILTKDGNKKIVDAGFAYYAHEDTAVIQIMVQDVTERTRVEKELQSVSSRNEVLLAAVPDIVAEVDANKTYTWLNRTGLEFFGEDAIGREASYYFEGEQETYDIVEPLFGGENNVIYVESWQRRKDGEKRLLAWWCRVLKDSEGNTTGALSTARDITVKDAAFFKLLPDIVQKAIEGHGADLELRQLREILKEENVKLVEANKKLRALDNIRSELLSTASDEWSQPLTIIREFIGQIRDGLAGPTTDDQKECLESALENYSILDKLLKNVLDLQQIQSGRLSIRRKRVDMTSLLRQTHSDFRRKCESRQQKLQLKLQDNLPAVLCDESRINQVLINLIDHAHRYAPDGGQLTIEAYRRGDHIVTTVRDDGPGTGKKAHDQISRKRGQSRKQHLPATQDNDLGLAIARSIIELHEEEISITGARGKQTEFRFNIPVYQEAKELPALLRDRMAESAAFGHDLFLTLLKLGTVEDLGQQLNDSGDIQLLRRIEKTIANTLDSTSYDALIIESEGLLAILTEADGDDDQTLITRVIQSIADEYTEIESVSCSTVRVVPDIDAEDWVAFATDRLIKIDLRTFGRRVLVVDNERDVLRNINNMLKAGVPDLKIETTTDGFEACNRLADDAPNLMVLNLNMPGFDCKKVLRQVKSSTRSRTTKVLAISESREGLDNIMELGADDCLAKPYDLRTLAEKVERLLRGVSAKTTEETRQNALRDLS
jgi:PAS domain S-box-containing protein